MTDKCGNGTLISAEEPGKKKKKICGSWSCCLSTNQQVLLINGQWCATRRGFLNNTHTYNMCPPTNQRRCICYCMQACKQSSHSICKHRCQPKTSPLIYAMHTLVIGNSPLFPRCSLIHQEHSVITCGGH